MKNLTQRILLVAFTQCLLLFVSCTNLHAQCNPSLFKTPEELVKNRLTGEGNYYGHPYTMFNKRMPNFNIQNELEYIRIQIKKEARILEKGSVYEAYEKVLALANTPKPAEVNADATDKFSKLAQWAKYNAFVLLIGLDAQGNPMNTEPYLNNVYAAF